MERKHNKKLVSIARTLRKNMTKEEKHLWYDFLRTYPIRFYRQKVLGRYIEDFYCATAKLVVEVDGIQHGEETILQKDKERTEYLEKYGISVLRVPNKEINRNFARMCVYIDEVVKSRVDNLPQ